jgi:hypothetical protein
MVSGWLNKMTYLHLEYFIDLYYCHEKIFNKSVRKKVKARLELAEWLKCRVPAQQV